MRKRSGTCDPGTTEPHSYGRALHSCVRWNPSWDNLLVIEAHPAGCPHRELSEPDPGKHRPPGAKVPGLSLDPRNVPVPDRRSEDGRDGSKPLGLSAYRATSPEHGKGQAYSVTRTQKGRSSNGSGHEPADLDGTVASKHNRLVLIPLERRKMDFDVASGAYERPSSRAWRSLPVCQRASADPVPKG